MESTKTFQVQFQPVGKRLSVPSGERLIEAARSAGIELASACGGEGNCGQCRIAILSGQVTPATEDEEFILNDLERYNGLRLACSTRILSDVKVQIPKDSLITGQRLQVESNLREIAVDPVVDAFQLELSPANLNDIRSDLGRVTEALCREQGICSAYANIEVIRALPQVLRQANWRISVFVRANEIVGVSPYGTAPLGFAVDLGTTKIAAYLVNLETGEELASTGAPNPQIGYGEDVISRLNYVYRNENGGVTLAEKVRSTLDESLGEMLEKAGARRDQVVEACIVGNTAMIHLLMELPVRQLATAPYVAAASAAMDVRASELGLRMAAGAYVHIPPIIGGFVGADHIAMVLASDLDQSDKVSLGVDIGTNTEISLRKPGAPHLTAASCASGPAFEGAHISDGMRAASGAIEKVRITDGGLELATVDSEPAVGLCGSGIIDTIAELYRSGLIDSRGRFQREQERVRMGSNGPEFLLVPASDSGSARDIVITQKDVNEIQLAKGAIHAGLKILLDATGTPPESVEEVVIAGAFGSFLNVKNAIAMGLFPELPKAQFRQVGNAAAIGAKWILISKSARLRAQKIAQNTRYNELTTYPSFGRQFALGMLFPGDSLFKRG